MKGIFGWLLMGLIAGVLLTGIGVPLTYFTSTKPRTLYTPIACVLVWLLYMVWFYLLICRPLNSINDYLEDGELKIDHNFIAKELNEFNEAADRLNKEYRSLAQDVRLLAAEVEADVAFPSTVSNDPF